MYLFTIRLAAVYYAILALLGKATIVSPLYIVLFALSNMVFGGGLEEVRWRFILQLALEKRFPLLLQQQE